LEPHIASIVAEARGVAKSLKLHAGAAAANVDESVARDDVFSIRSERRI